MNLNLMELNFYAPKLVCYINWMKHCMWSCIWFWQCIMKPRWRHKMGIQTTIDQRAWAMSSTMLHSIQTDMESTVTTLTTMMMAICIMMIKVYDGDNLILCVLNTEEWCMMGIQTTIYQHQCTWVWQYLEPVWWYMMQGVMDNYGWAIHQSPHKWQVGFMFWKEIIMCLLV